MPQEKEWFEANYLDGDKIQDGQMLSSKLCFEAVEEAQKAKMEEIKSDLLKIADEGEYEDLRREVEHYFSNLK